MKCGIVSIVGRPNVGKSSLLNAILDTKLAITSNVAGTTRNIINGIYNDEDSQIIFVDTPGVHKPVNKLGSIMNKKTYNNTEGVDIILFMIDATTSLGKGDKFILNKIKNKNTPIFLLLNKIDLIKDKRRLLKTISDISKIYNFTEVIPLSAKSKDNINELLKCIKKYLPEGDKIYADDDFTNVTTRFLIAELVREKVLLLTKDEVPHSVTCYTEEYTEEKNIINIRVVIVVDRDNLKKIIIGKQGKMLKEIGIEARQDMEKLLGKKVYLETYVKSIKNWKDREKYLIELGLEEKDE